MESQDILLMESGILGFGIQKVYKESGLPLTIIGIHGQKPSSTDKDWNPRCGIQNSRLAWIPFYGAIIYLTGNLKVLLTVGVRD